MEIKKIAVLYGGNSSEREVSLESGRSIFEAILLLGYEASLIDYPKEFSHETIKDHDYIFIALHGEDGESGALQNLLQGQDILFSGSSADACQNTWNKNRCKEILKKNNILTKYALLTKYVLTKYALLTKYNSNSNAIQEERYWVLALL